jgi:Transposase DDE domain
VISLLAMTQHNLDPQSIRDMFETILPNEGLRALIDEAKWRQRNRKLQAEQLVRAAIIAAGSGSGGRMMGMMKHYIALGGEPVARSAFYGWFGAAFETVMEGVLDRAFAFANAQSVDLPGVLGRHVKDWRIVDSTTVRLDDELLEEYPGAGDYAALKVHKIYSVGIGTLVAAELSPAVEHDSQHLRIDESWRGYGLLVDLGYASLDRLRACERHDVRYIIRLKENWKPRVQSMARGKLMGTFAKGTDLAELIDDEILVLDGRAIDCDVEIGRGRTPVATRLVGISTDRGYRFYLTNLPRDVGPAQVSDLYRVRWEIEHDNKINKSLMRLDEVEARTGSNVRSLVLASLVSTVLCCLITHLHRIQVTVPEAPSMTRTKAPLHPALVGSFLGATATILAQLFELDGAQADERWRWYVHILVHLASDPNWRRTPSILDQLRGWPLPKSAHRRKRKASRALSPK